MGEPRLIELESQLPPDVATLGVDEHTAVIFDFDADTVTVHGRSNGYWRLNGATTVLTNSTTTSLDDLRNATPYEPQNRVDGPAEPTLPSPLALAETASQGGDAGREALATLVRLASTGGAGFIEPSELIEGVLRAREQARSDGQYKLADELRDAITAAGIQVKDTPEGSTWSLGALP